MAEKDSKIVSLESDLERINVDRPDMTSVLAELESGKVAASRALLQNQEIKDQLDEIQKAYIQVVGICFFLIFKNSIKYSV